MCATVLFLSMLAADASKPAELPKSPAAVQAKKVLDQQVKWAQAQFDQTVAIARTDYLASLKQALQVALKGGNLDESNRIDAEIKAIQEAAKPEDKGKDEPFSLAGSWDFNYSNGTVNGRIIGRDGKVEGGGVVKRWARTPSSTGAA